MQNKSWLFPQWISALFSFGCFCQELKFDACLNVSENTISNTTDVIADQQQNIDVIADELDQEDIDNNIDIEL